LRSDYTAKSAYRQIRDAARAARDAERALMYRGGTDDQGYATDPPDWKPVLQLAPQVIAEQSKDLEIAAVLVEALVRKNGFAGLRDGFALVRRLIECFWDQLYPLPDAEGVRDRVFPLIGLNGEGNDGVLAAPLLRVPITSAGASGSFSTIEYRQALEVESIADLGKRDERMQQLGAVPMGEFTKSAAETSEKFYRNLLEDLDQASAEFLRVCELLDEKCGPDSPPSSNIREALRAVRRDIERVAAPVLGSGATPSEGEQAAQTAASAAAGASGGVPTGPIATRDEALQALARVAEFFRRTEPHNPISYTLEQAIRWARMPLPQLLQELIPDPSTRDQLFKWVGIQHTP
jgi:type VI secretion system protein ImpA